MTGVLVFSSKGTIQDSSLLEKERKSPKTTGIMKGPGGRRALKREITELWKWFSS